MSLVFKTIIIPYLVKLSFFFSISGIRRDVLDVFRIILTILEIERYGIARHMDVKPAQSEYVQSSSDDLGAKNFINIRQL